MSLTELWLKSNHNKPREKTLVKTDLNGMSARVSPKGKIVFQVRFRFDGKPHRMDIGAYPHISLKEARAECAKIRSVLERGLNPKIEKKVELATINNAHTFKEVFTDWYQSYCVKNKKGHHEILRSFEIYVFPELGDFPINRISINQWLRLLENVASQYTSIAARILFNSKQLYQWALKRELVDANVLIGISAKNDLNYKKLTVDRVLSDQEIIMIFDAIKHSRMTPKNKLFVELCLMFGCRNGELRDAEKRHFNLDTKVWTVPPENHKTGVNTGKPLLRPITPQAEDLILEAIEFSDSSSYLFCNSGESAKLSKSAPLALPYNIMQWLRRHRGYEMDHWSMHDLRRTARTNFSRLTTYEVAEIMLGHSLPKIQATYDHYDYLEEQKAAYIKWHEKLAALKEQVK